MLLVVLAAAATALVLVAYNACWRRPRGVMSLYARHGIRSKPFVPVLGQLGEFDQVMKTRGEGAMVRYWVESARELGDNYVFCVGPVPFLLLSDPEYFKEIFTSKAPNYHKTSDTNKWLVRPLLGNGLLMSEGALWKRQRAAVEPYFHHVNLASLVPSIVRAADGMVERWRAVGEGGEVEAHHALGEVGLDVVGTAAFGKSFHEDRAAAEAITRALTGALDEVRERVLVTMVPYLNRAPLPSLRRMEAHCRVVHDAVREIIDARRAERREEASDLLDMLLAMDMEEQQMFDECVNFMAAGAETTSNLMTWLLYKLVERPGLWEACGEEVARVMPEGEEPTYETLRSLPLLEACAYEALRLYAPAPAVHKLAMRDHVLRVRGGRELPVPAGTNILIQGQVVHRREDEWPDADVFNPYRFLEGDAAGDSGPRKEPRERHAFSWMGFSHGPRKCLGKNFAMLEIKTVMVRLLQNFTFEVAPGQDIFPDWSSQAPKNGILLRVRSRTEPLRRSAGAKSADAGSVQLAKPVGMI